MHDGQCHAAGAGSSWVTALKSFRPGSDSGGCAYPPETKLSTQQMFVVTVTAGELPAEPAKSSW